MKIYFNNLQYGKVWINSERLELTKNYATINKLTYDINDLLKIHHTRQDLYNDLIDSAYLSIINLRLEGLLEGEMIDTAYETIVKDLRNENESLKKDNQRLHNENLLLAGELRDRQNIIERYEKPFTKKQDNKDESK